jgi:hypothetical protein
MIKRLLPSGVAFAALALFLTHATASTVLFNTGVDSSGNVLAGGSSDPNWTLSGSVTGQPVVLSGSGGAFFVWTANDATGSPGSAWIGIANQQSPPGTTALGGSYTFSQTFFVSNPSTAALAGTWWIDDTGFLAVNGNTVDTQANDYTGVSFTVPSADFVMGLNTISVTMTVGDGLWDGTRVSFSTVQGITAATPLPAALPLFAGGLGALGVLGWRRKRKAAAA